MLRGTQHAQDLLDQARRRNADKRGDGNQKLSLDGSWPPGWSAHAFIAVNNAFEHPRRARPAAGGVDRTALFRWTYRRGVQRRRPQGNPGNPARPRSGQSLAPPIPGRLVGQTIALCGLPPSGSVGRRHKTNRLPHPKTSLRREYPITAQSAWRQTRCCCRSYRRNSPRTSRCCSFRRCTIRTSPPPDRRSP